MVCVSLRFVADAIDTNQWSLILVINFIFDALISGTLPINTNSCRANFILMFHRLSNCIVNKCVNNGVCTNSSITLEEWVVKWISSGVAILNIRDSVVLEERIIEWVICCIV